LLERGSVEDLDVLIEDVARGIGLVELGVDLSRPAQHRLLSIAPEHVVDGRVAGQHAGNDGKHTKNDKTGHYQPIPSSHFCV
jgi:hypothetical protein